MTLKDYISELNKQFRTGIAREHSYRPALQQMMSAILPDMVVTNEPARIECGAPDYIISRISNNTPVFFVEAKDIDEFIQISEIGKRLRELHTMEKLFKLGC